MTMSTVSDLFRNFNTPVSKTITNAISLQEHMTLRNACIDYRDAGGARWVHNDLPEASAAVSTDQIPCLNRFSNIVGHMQDNTMISFPLCEAQSFSSMMDILESNLHSCFSTGRLWAIPGTVMYSNDGRWICGDNIVQNRDINILNMLSVSYGVPLSANISHAAMEADHYGSSIYSKIFLYPHNAAPSTGLIGSLHDNQCIDMSPGEQNKQPNIELRSFKPEYIGYICAGHTSHSTEAGRVRRVACSVRVRILTPHTIEELRTLLDSRTDTVNTRADRWTLFCMGIYCTISADEFKNICRNYRRLSLAGYVSFSLHINDDIKLVVISISSGTLVKHTSNGYHADNIQTYRSSPVSYSIKPVIHKTGKDQHRACFSAFFNLIPYISSNRAPRPLISSVQTPQAVCLPWCPGDAAVSPCYTFNPVITTPLYSHVMEDLNDDATNTSNYLPGENVLCLFLNLEGNYEDAILVSKRYVDNGGFSTVSMCSYNIPQSESIPPVGSTMCGILYPWWKSSCQKYCTHKAQDLEKGKRYVIGYKPTGVVYSVTDLRNGDKNIKIKSHQVLQDGDKLSMGHGQKGIAVITPYEDMPIAYNNIHGEIVPDIVMAMSSVVTRQTNGALYEACKSLSLFHNKEKLPYIAEPCETADVSDEFEVKSGITGEFYTTTVHDEDNTIKHELTKATIGIIRVFNQTQMSRERHQISHVNVGKRMLRTPGGRARGGGVAWGEMEVQSTSSAGLQSCDDEISGRGDRVVGKVCTECQRLGLLCTCTTEEYQVPVKLPYDTVVFDCISSIVYNGSFQYNVSPEA
jgi:RNA polymerase Rpb2, domain 6